MAWEESLIVSGGTFSNLIAGGATAEPAADYGTISAIGDGIHSGVLNDVTAVSAGRVYVYSGGIASAWCRRKGTSPLLRIFVVLSAIAISVSTAFVKQHSVVDILAAIPLCLLAALFVRLVEKKQAAKSGTA